MFPDTSNCIKAQSIKSYQMNQAQGRERKNKIKGRKQARKKERKKEREGERKKERKKE